MKDNVVYYNDKKKYIGKLRLKKRLKKILLLFLILLFIFLLYILFFYNRPEIIEARYGEIIDGFNTEAIIIRDETKYIAGDSGIINLFQNEGKRLSSGEKVLEINGSLVFNHHPGLISYTIDGLENNLHPSEINNYRPEDFKNINYNIKRISSSQYVNTGDPLYKIINNNYLYLMFLVNKEEADRYRLNEIIFVEDDSINTGHIRGRVINITSEGDLALMTVSLNRFIDQWLDKRQVDIKFIKNIYRGIVIPRSAVFNQPAGRGVLVIDDSGRYQFKRINISNSTADYVIVTNLNVGERVIANPESVNFGQEG